jgi:tetratricopeptide (TPR) repeat protein
MQMKPGQIVRLQSIGPRYDGAIGRVTEFEASTGKYTVVMDITGLEHRLRPEKVTRVSSGQCYICLETDPEPVSMGCACRGEIVHLTCLGKSIAHQHARTPALEAYTRCFVCKQEFEGAAKLHLANLWFMRCRTSHPVQRLHAAAQIAECYHTAGRLEEALELFESSRLASSAYLGEGHPDTIAYSCRLASVLNSIGRYSDAEALHSSILPHAPDSRSRIACHINLAESAALLGRNDEACALYELYVPQLSALLGTDHHEVLTARSSYGLCLTEACAYQAAQSVLDTVCCIRTRVLGAEHQLTMVAMSNLAIAISGTGDLARAESIQRHLLSIQMRIVGAEDRRTLANQVNLASTLKAMGRLAEAEAMYRSALATEQRVLGAAHPTTFATILNLGDLMCNFPDRRGEVFAMFLEMYPRMLSSLGAEHPHTRAVGSLMRRDLTDTCAFCCEGSPTGRSGCACDEPVHVECCIRLAMSQHAARGTSAWSQCFVCKQTRVGPVALALAEALLLKSASH